MTESTDANSGGLSDEVAMMRNPHDQIHNPSPEFSLFDEALLSCADGHCLFDQNGCLLSWSVSFGDFYPKIRHKIRPGYSYAVFIKDLIEHRVLKNIKPIGDIDDWIASHLEQLGDGCQFVHHLADGRYMAIRYTRLSNGYWFFAASEITESFLQKEELRESKEKFESFAEIASDWFWELDSDLKYTYLSNHNAPLGVSGDNGLVGMSRNEHVLGGAIDNANLREHCAAFEAHEEVNVVLTWYLSETDKNYVHTQVRALPKYDRHGNFSGYLGCSKNVTTEYGLKQQLEFQAAHDELTGLINRRAFGQCLNISLRNRSSAQGTEIDVHRTLTFIDLDQFKMVNDNAGHLAGDQLLIDVTRIFQSLYSHEDDIIARLGGDEFAILSANDAQQAKLIADKLIKIIGEFRFLWDERTFSIGASAGIVVLDDTSTDDSDLLSKADSACYSAKMSGRNQAHMYSSDGAFISSRNDEIGKLELINESLINDRLSLYLQPIVPTGAKEERQKYEVLLRLSNTDGKLVSPGAFIPVAEKYDRMPHLDMWVVEKTFQGIEKFRELGESVSLSVNLSGNTLSNESCLDQITKLVDKHDFEPGTLCFEVTETAAIKGIEKACKFIDQLRQRDCEFSLDDFGSGFCSFSYLRSLNVDYLKIDGCFVSNLVDDPSNRAIVASFNTLAHELGIKTIAEYVESQEIIEVLTEMNIDYLQGFGVGQPQLIDAWLDLFAQQQKLTGT